MNFRQLDLNLLRVLCAIHRSGSVTEAGRQLALSQPATSNALARLRRSFDDALFVRSTSGLHPTRLAQRIAPLVAAHLRELEAALADHEVFDPARAAMHWRLSLSDLGEMMFLPPLAAALRSLSPGSQLSNVATEARQVSAALEARDIDLAIGILPPEHRGVASEPLFHEHFVAITGSHWRPAPAAARAPGGRTGTSLGAQQLARAALAVAAPAATCHGSVDAMLARLKLSERVVIHLRHYGAVPELVSGSDLMAIVPQMFARAVAQRHDIRVWQLPARGPHYAVRMMWHESAGNDAAHAWLRAQVRHLFAHDDTPQDRHGQP